MPYPGGYQTPVPATVPGPTQPRSGGGGGMVVVGLVAVALIAVAAWWAVGKFKSADQPTATANSNQPAAPATTNSASPPTTPAPASTSTPLEAYAGEWIVVRGADVDANESSRRFRLWVNGNRVEGVAGQNEGTFELTLAADGSLKGELVVDADRAPVTFTLSSDKRELALTIQPPGQPTITAYAERFTQGTSQTTNPTASEPIASPPTSATATEIRPSLISASASAPAGRDGGGDLISYTPDNAIDGIPETAWRIPGDGVGQYIQLDFSRPTRVTEVRILPGYFKVDRYDGTDRFWQNRRVRRVRLEFSDGRNVEAMLADEPSIQPVRVNAGPTSFVRIVILESTLPDQQNGRDFTAISEISVVGQ